MFLQSLTEITRYRMKEENLVGYVKEKKEAYDLLTTMMICLGSSKTTENELLQLLDVLFKDNKNPKEKNKS